MFKKIVLLLSVGILSFGLVSCGAEENNTDVAESSSQEVIESDLEIIGDNGNRVIIVDVPMSEMEELDLYSQYFVAQPNKDYLPAPYLQMWDMGFRIADNHTEQSLVQSGISERVILEDAENNLKISCDFYNETDEEYAPLVSCKTYNVTVLQGNENIIFPKGITIGSTYEKIKQLSEQYYCLELSDYEPNTIVFLFVQYPYNYAESMTNNYLEIKVDTNTGLVKEMTKQNGDPIDLDNPTLHTFYSAKTPDTSFEMYGSGGPAYGNYSWPIKCGEEVALTCCSNGFYLDDDEYALDLCNA